MATPMRAVREKVGQMRSKSLSVLFASRHQNSAGGKNCWENSSILATLIKLKYLGRNKNAFLLKSKLIKLQEEEI